MDAYLDTHVVLRLSQAELTKISRTACQAVDRYRLFISPIVMLELEFLYELGRSRKTAQDNFAHLEEKLGLALCPLPFPQIARAACRESWTRDTFDRIIVAHARFAPNAPLITADEHIHAHYPHAIW